MNPSPRLQARKRFGQHFLHDTAIIGRIVDTIRPQAENRLVEIGPGRGALTLPLLESGARLDAIELDRDLIPALQSRCAAFPGFKLHLADALKFDYAALASEAELRLVGNLPYNISTPLLFRLLKEAPHIHDMHFMLQKEVVDRLTAAPGSRDYGRLTVTVAARAKATALFDVEPGAFSPPPRVWSSVVRIQPRAPDFPLHSQEHFDRIVTAAFAQRRKTLANSLRRLLDPQGIESADIDPGLRAERLAPADFARLADRLAATTGPETTHQ